MRLLTEKTLNYDAQNDDEINSYLNYRSKQLLKFGYQEKKRIINDFSHIVIYSHAENPKTNYGAIYIKNSERGKGLFRKTAQDYGLTIVTLEECDIENYLIKYDIPHVLLNNTLYYKLIQKYYGDDRAKRSGVPSIYHIDEGLQILNNVNASELARHAYCLHPMFQSDIDFERNYRKVFDGVNSNVMALCIEYRRVANSYLSKNEMKDFVGITNKDIRDMLIADKVQNYKDFLKHHKGKHERSKELDVYFNNWFFLLNINYENFKDIMV